MLRPIGIILESDRRYKSICGIIKLVGFYERLCQETMTFFAPVNAAFINHEDEGYSQIINYPRARLVAFVEHHMVRQVIRLTDLLTTPSITPVDGHKLQISRKKEEIFINQSLLLKPDHHASNGIIQSIDKLL